MGVRHQGDLALQSSRKYSGSQRRAPIKEQREHFDNCYTTTIDVTFDLDVMIRFAYIASLKKSSAFNHFHEFQKATVAG
jgi:hypothetical protein